MNHSYKIIAVGDNNGNSDSSSEADGLIYFGKEVVLEKEIHYASVHSMTLVFIHSFCY